MNATGGQAVHVGGLEPRLAHEAEGVVSVVVGQDEHDIGPSIGKSAPAAKPPVIALIAFLLFINPPAIVFRLLLEIIPALPSLYYHRIPRTTPGLPFEDIAPHSLTGNSASK